MTQMIPEGRYKVEIVDMQWKSSRTDSSNAKHIAIELFILGPTYHGYTVFDRIPVFGRNPVVRQMFVKRWSKLMEAINADVTDHTGYPWTEEVLNYWKGVWVGKQAWAKIAVKEFTPENFKPVNYNVVLRYDS